MTEGMVHVPTMDELVKEGLAEQVVTESRNKNGKLTKSIAHRMKPEGQRKVTDAMLHNGEYLRTHDEERKALETQAVHDARNSVE